MVDESTRADTILLTTHRDDLVQGRIGQGLEKLLQTPVDVAEFDELEFVIDDEVEVFWKGTEIGDYIKIIIYGGVSRLLRITHPLAIALKSRNLDVYTSGAENFKGLDKLTQNVFFSINDIPIPKTYFAAPEKMVERAGEVVGFPMILKDILASQGERNYLIKTQADLESKLNEMQENRFIAQQYIKNDGDMRILINSKHDVFAFTRHAKPGLHINNTSAGATAEAVEDAPQTLLAHAKTIIEELKMPLLGIDVIDRDGQYYFLEANVQPMIFTGALVEAKRLVLKSAINS